MQMHSRLRAAGAFTSVLVKPRVKSLFGFSNVVFFVALDGVDHMAESFVFKMK